MILSNLNDYCYIFEPNILKVVCENTSVPTKEVTLISNGITLKRNCIASVAYFDMSVLFESYFNAATFALDYSANANDPFFATCLFTISAPDETTQTDVSKKLRWGAYQFDEVYSNADFKFPYWPGYPLVINSSKNHDETIITSTESYDGTYSGVKTIPSDAVDQFTQETKLATVKVQTITFEPQSCPTGHYLQWIGTHGQIWHYMFYASRERQITKEIKSGEIIPYYPLSLTDSQFGRGKVIEKIKDRSFGCFQSVDETIYPIVESILFSPIVKYWTNSKWIEVKIKDNAVTPQRSGMVDIEFMVELPTDFNQRR